MLKQIGDAINVRRAALKDSEHEKGFTLIELMVVIIIIGILGAIAIPVFLNQRQGAWDATTKSDLANLENAAATYSVNHNGTYTGMTLGSASPSSGLEGTPYGYQTSTGTSTPVIVVASDGQSYTVYAFSTNFGTTTTTAAGHVFTFNSKTGLTTTS